MIIHFFRQKCDVNNAQNFADYITILKLILNARIVNTRIVNFAYDAYFKFVEKPYFFIKNLHQLFEVDALHRQILEREQIFLLNSREITR